MTNADLSSIPEGTLVAGRYRIGRLIASGGMGAVHEAVDTKLDREVAIKTLRGDLVRDTSLVARFEREARLAAQLNHPNIVQVHDFGWAAKGLLYIVMERVHGETIATLLSREGRMDPRRAADIAEQALAGLAKAHGAGVLHRDIKPGNIMIVSSGESRELVKVLDFGLAQLMQGEAYTRLTQTGVIVGTPAYMPPEQAQGDALDARADVYAVGVLLWCMLTGRKPFIGESVADVVQAVLTYEPPRADALAPVPHELATVAEIAMRKNPAERFPDANAMGRALVACRARLSAPAVPPDAEFDSRELRLPGDTTSMGALSAETLAPPPRDPSRAQAPAGVDTRPAPVAAAKPTARQPSKHALALLIGGGVLALFSLTVGAALLLFFGSRAFPFNAQPAPECAQAFACCEAFQRPRGQLALCAPLQRSTVPGLCADMVSHYDGLLRTFGPAARCPLPAGYVEPAAPTASPPVSAPTETPIEVLRNAPAAPICEQAYRCCLDWSVQHDDPPTTCNAYRGDWSNDRPRCENDIRVYLEFERAFGEVTPACEATH